MTELNLEYLATGEIKIYYKKRRQKKIRAKYLPSAPDNKPLGHIKFYTRNRRKVIEELDASPWDSILLAKEDTVDEDMVKMTDSLEKLRTAAEASSVVLDSLQKQADRQALIDRITGRKKKKTENVAPSDSLGVISEEEQSGKSKRRLFKKKDDAEDTAPLDGDGSEVKEKKRSRKNKNEDAPVNEALSEEELQRRQEEAERQALIDRITGRTSKAKQEEKASTEPPASASEEQSEPQVEQEQVEQTEPKEHKRSRRKKEEASSEEQPVSVSEDAEQSEPQESRRSRKKKEEPVKEEPTPEVAPVVSATPREETEEEKKKREQQELIDRITGRSRK